MPVTLALPLRDHKRPPPLPLSTSKAEPVAEPAPLPSMRVPKGTHSRAAEQASEQIDVQAAVLAARRKTEEMEWQAQVARAKQALGEGETDEWAALRARASTQMSIPPPARARPKKPNARVASAPAPVVARVLPLSAPAAVAPVARAPAAPAKALVDDGAAQRAAEEREWEELRVRARIAEEREWEALIARARAVSTLPLESPAPRPSPRARPVVVAWP